ncbi:MAG: hypothetical protein WCN92_06865, partial [Eubacteriales bacterium]
GYTATSIQVLALLTTSSDTGVVATYKDSSVGSLDIYATNTAEKISFQARIPVTCSGISHIWVGSGTLGDPWLIRTKSELDEMRNHTIKDEYNVDYFGGYYRLNNNITFSSADYDMLSGDFYNGGNCFVPISGGTGKLPFVGSLDGNGYTISGLVIKNTGGTYTGLFEQSGKQTIRKGGADVEVSAAFSNIVINSAVIEGDNGTCTHAGTLVAYANNTAFSGITVNNATISKVTAFAGGIVGQAAHDTDSLCTLTGSTVNASSITVLTGGAAGGIAGRFGGTIGAVPTLGYDVQVLNSAIKGDSSGGLVGHNYQLPLTVQYALVSGGSVTSETTVDEYSAGGILGLANGLGDYAVSITHTKVALGTSVTAVCIAGGVMGKMGVKSTTAEIVNLLLIDNTESYATVSATAAAGTSNAGGIVGNLSNALIVKITNGVAGGSVSGKANVGGIIAYIEGADDSYEFALYDHTNTVDFVEYEIKAINSLVSNFVVSSAISSYSGANNGLILGDAYYILMMESQTYTYMPFENIKYSSYQYATGRNMIGDGIINAIQSPDLKATIYDLNKGYDVDWTGTYKGLRFYDGIDETLAVLPIGGSVAFTGSNVLLPLFPGSYGFTGGSVFDSFIDTTGVSFTLDTVTTNILGLVTSYASRTLSIVSGQGTGDLVFNYLNGLKLSLNIIAYSDLLGKGTLAEPYQIWRTGQLELVRALPSKYFIQMDNLTFTTADFQNGGAYYNAGLLWEPIMKVNSSSVYFSGNYNGNNKTVSGMKIARPSQDYIGLFAKISVGAKVYNLTIANATVAGRNYVGTLAGEITGSGATPTLENVNVLNCAVSSVATGTSITPIRVGGLVAVEKTGVQQPTSPNIFNCHVTSTSVSTGTGIYTYAGGIAAEAQSIEDCVADNITINAGLYAAGIAVRSSISLFSGANTPLLIKDCTVSGTNGVSQINAKYNGSSASAAGIMAYMNKKIQITIDNCLVTQAVAIKSIGTTSGGAAGGIMGVIDGPETPLADFKATIIGSQSYASVTGRNEAGGVIGAIKGSGVNLADILVEGCVGGGDVIATSTTASVAGGIIGSVSGTSFVMTTGAFLKDNVSSALISIAFGTNKGKLVGNCASITTISETVYPTVFDNNYISSFPQDIAPFGNSTMSASQNLGDSVTDLMLCKQISGQPVESFTVRNILSEEYYPIAIATYGTPAVTTNFKARIYIWNGTAPVELAASQPLFVDAYHSFAVSKVTASTSAEVTWGVSGNELNIGVKPASKESGAIEADIGYGLTISVPLVTFNIDGTGVAGNPFQVLSAEHLTLMYYLNKSYYKQMNDIAITSNDYAVGVYNPSTGEYDGRGVLYSNGYVGFKPIGTLAKPFTGSYNGNNNRISGLYTNNKEMDYMGLFGYVSGSSSLSNIHIELTSNTDAALGGITGRFFVGGLAGYCDSSVAVQNCSVAFGNVTGRQSVGGLIGYSSSSISKSFTSCDVLAVGTNIVGLPCPGEVGGLVGRVFNNTTTALSISGSFATGSIYSGTQNAGGLVGRADCASTSTLNVTNSFFTGDINAGGTAPTSIL